MKRGVDTYWLKYPVRVGVGQRHSLRLDGGSEEFRYAVYASYQNVAGAMKDSRRSTLSGGMLLRYDRKAFTFQNELIATFNRSENSPYGSFSLYTRLNPYYVPRDAEGKLKKMLEERYSPFKQVVGNPLYDAAR